MNVPNRTPRMRGNVKCNRTLHESPATASLHSATPKRKNVPCFSYFRGGGFFLKWKGYFSFWGSTLQVFGQCGEEKCGLGKAKIFFLGKGFFTLPRLIFLGEFGFGFRPQKGVWGMNAGGKLFEFLAASIIPLIL